MTVSLTSDMMQSDSDVMPGVKIASLGVAGIGDNIVDGFDSSDRTTLPFGTTSSSSL